MADFTQMGQAGLKGWRVKVGDGLAPAVSRRTPLDEDQVRALVGAVFFALSVSYVVKTAGDLVRSARD